MFSSMTLLAEEQMPSMDFLEYLGEWETEDGEWIDPIELDDEDMGKLIETTGIQKVNDKTDNEN